MNDNRSSRDQQQLDEILAELMRVIDAGQAIDSDDWLARYPEFAAELQEFLRQQERVRELVGPLRLVAAKALHVRCPHCHNPIELLDDAALAEISCPSCGSSFSLAGDGTVSHYHPGERTVGHFQLLDRVGVGQFGSVWKARDTKLDRTVAIKIPRNSQLDGSQVELFLRDARAAAQLRHPNISTVHEVGKHGETIYIVSDFIQGATLKEWIAERRLTPREAAQLCRQIADALHHAHDSGVIHRDLKPGNIMMDTDGEPHIVDFGLAKREAGEITMTLEGQILGTPAYMSPEQARGEGHSVDRRADIYSLGVILFELLTGELPFRGDKQMLIVQILKDDPPSPRKLNNSIPRDLETICMKCMEKEPSQRYYGTGAELASDLVRFLRREPIRARPYGTVALLARWTRRRPAVAASLTLTLITAMLLVAIVVSGHFNRELNELNTRLELSNSELSRAATLATEKQAEADRERARAVLKEELSRRHMYAANILLAQQKLDLEQTKHAYHILQRLRDGDTRDLRGFEWHYLWRKARGESSTFCVAPSDIASLAYHPDGNLLAIGTVDGNVAIWSVEPQMRLHEYNHGVPIRSLHFRETGEIAFSGTDRNVMQWNFFTGEVRRVDSGNGLAAALAHSNMGISPDGTTTVTVTDNGAIVFRDIAKDEIVRRGHLWMLSSHVEYSDDGKLLAVAGEGGVSIVDALTGSELSRITGSQKRTIHCMTFAPNSDRIAVGETLRESGRRSNRPRSERYESEFPQDVLIRVYDVADTKHPKSFEFGNRVVNSLAFSPDGNNLVAAIDREVLIWSLKDEPPTRITDRPDSQSTLKFDRDGKLLATIHDTPPRVVLRDAITGAPKKTFPGNSGKIYDVAFDRTTQIIAAACAGSGIETWDIETGVSRGRFESKGACFRVRFDPAGRFMAAGGYELTVWDLRTLAIVHERQRDRTRRTGWRAGIAFSPDGRQLAVGTQKAGVQTMDTSNWQTRWQHDPGFEIISLAFTPDGKHLAGCGWDHRIWFWDATTGEVAKTLPGPSGAHELEFSGDGRRFVTGHSDSALLWDTASGSQLLSINLAVQDGSQFRRSRTRGSVVTISSDGRRIATGGNQIIIW